MSNKIFFSIDNGVSGSLGFIHPDGKASFYLTPIKKCLNYTKVARYVNRIDVFKLKEIITNELKEERNVICALERPMINPTRFQASLSAIRALEATLVVLEELKIPYCYIDSKEWTKILPSGLEGSEQLKAASLDIGKRLFPDLSPMFKKDADGILIAEYLRQKENKPTKKL